MNTEINIGDVVRLKSGGPSMTVDATTESRYVCVWFDNGYHRQTFDEAALEKLDGFKTKTYSVPIPQTTT